MLDELTGELHLHVRQWVPWLFSAAVLWMLVKVLYNLYLHPLRAFPGPKLAAASLWWQVHLEVFKGESLCMKLVELHRIYGDVVRIGPNELHFAKPSAYYEIYGQKNRWAKDAKLYHLFAEEESTFTIYDYARAKRRRDITSPIFSRQNVVKMQHVVQECLDAASKNIDAHIDQGRPINLFHLYRSCSLDVVFAICFARTMNAASTPGFHAPIVHSLHAALPIIPVFKHFPYVQSLTNLIPNKLASFLNPTLTGLLQMRGMLERQIKEVKGNPEALTQYPYRTIYHELLKDPSEVPSDLSLRDEAVLFVNAGTDTASDALTLGTLHVVHNSHIYERLRQELDVAWPNLHDMPRYEELERLPYLTAVLKESLRLSHGVVQPMTRVVPAEGAHVSGHFIPGGTVVAISNIFVHWDEDIFPDARTFRPERWLGAEGQSLDPWLVAFSKGPRSCLGINLAWCELYMVFANIFRRYDLHPDIMTPAQWRFRDCYVPRYEGPDVLVQLNRRLL